MSNPNILDLIENFAKQLTALVESAAAERIQSALAAAFGTSSGVSSRTALPSSLATVGPKTGRPKQLCPVPGCTNVAAPVFGMVCAEHRNVPKARVKAYRAARKADAASTVATKAAGKRKAPKRTAKLVRARKLQGAYLGALRALSAADKLKVKAVAKDKGVAAAVKLAAGLKKSKK